MHLLPENLPTAESRMFIFHCVIKVIRADMNNVKITNVIRNVPLFAKLM
jgi:hypothetical protein